MCALVVSCSCSDVPFVQLAVERLRRAASAAAAAPVAPAERVRRPAAREGARRLRRPRQARGERPRRRRAVRLDCQHEDHTGNPSSLCPRCPDDVLTVLPRSRPRWPRRTATTTAPACPGTGDPRGPCPSSGTRRGVWASASSAERSVLAFASRATLTCRFVSGGRRLRQRSAHQRDFHQECAARQPRRKDRPAQGKT